MSPTMELPAVREKRLEKIRLNTRFIQKDYIADTTIGKTHKLFTIGAIDWYLQSIQPLNGLNNTRLNVVTGGTLAGGELTARLNYSNQKPFTEKHQHYFWRYVNNNARVVRQITAGKIRATPISTILDYIVGAQISNVPSFRETSFGTFSHSGYTEPGWMVELYINNLLVNYAKADASGFFIFDIPLSYGNTEAVLRFYGPWGEEKVSKVFFNIPFNFLPVNEFEYTVSSGFVQDAGHSRFSQVKMDYGVSRHLTVGGGAEYLSSLFENNLIPFFHASAHVTPKVLFTGEYAHGVRSKGKLSYLSPSNFQIDLSHVAYEEGQKAVKYNYTRETAAAIGRSFRILDMPFYSRLTLAQNTLQTSQFANLNFLLSASVRNASVNVATYAFARSETTPYIYTNVSSAVMLPFRTIINSQVRYSHSENKVSFIQFAVKKNILGNATIQARYERDLVTGMNTFQAGFIFDLSVARLDLSANYNKSQPAFFLSATGTMTADPSSNYFRLNNNPLVGKGGLILSPFLDMNGNGKRDENEPTVKGLRVKANGGRIEKNEKDNRIVISGLEPFTNYFIQLDQSEFESISWHLKNASMRIEIEPNRLKLIEIPVAVLGEASGMINLDEAKEQRGTRGLTVNFYREEDNKLSASTTSESDGFFTYMGLAPGKYYATIDSTQLNHLQMTSHPARIPFVIDLSKEGDYEDQLLFVLKKKEDDHSDQ